MDVIAKNKIENGSKSTPPDIIQTLLTMANIILIAVVIKYLVWFAIFLKWLSGYMYIAILAMSLM